MYMNTLARVSLETIRSTFSLAFSDYELPVYLTGDALREMIISRDISMEKSVGCFDGDALVGFILCGFREKAEGATLYDAGTGVLPSYRGKHIGSGMLEWLLQAARKQGIERFLLEVLEHNEPAIHLYEKHGFVKTRRLRCYRINKNHIPKPMVDACCHFRPLSKEQFLQLDHAKYLSGAPSWQNDIPSVLNNWERLAALAVMRDESVAGFGLVHRIKGDLPILAVPDKIECSEKMTGMLISALAPLTESDKLSLLNVEEGSSLHRHLENEGWKNFVNQFEMLSTLRK